MKEKGLIYLNREFNKKLGFFDADSRELAADGSLIFRPRVVPMAEKLNKLYELVEKDYAVLVFNVCCSGRKLQPDSRKDVLFIPADGGQNRWKSKVAEYSKFYIEKKAGYNPTQDVLCGCFNSFSQNENGAALIDELGVDQWVVFGNGLDFCVDNAVKSLLKNGREVIFLSDVMISSATGYGRSGTDESRRATYENWVKLGATAQTLEEFLDYMN